MKSLTALIGRVQRRSAAAMALRLAGRGLLAGLAVAGVVLAADRFTVSQWPWRVYALIAGAGLALGAMGGAIMRPSARDAAVLIDRRLRLKDRVGTGQALLDQPASALRHDQDFAALAIAQAEALAQRLDVRGITPVRITGEWPVALALGVLLWAGVLFIPARSTPAAGGDNAAAAALAARVTEQDRALVDEIVNIAATQPGEGVDAGAVAGQGDDALALTPQEADALDRLARHMQGREPENQPSGAESKHDSGFSESDIEQGAAALGSLAERLAEQARREQAAADEVARRFGSLDEASAPAPPQRHHSLKEFRQAMERGDFGDAARAIEQALEHSRSLPQDEREQVAREMERLGDAIEQAQVRKNQQETEQREQLRQALRDMGVDEHTARKALGPDDNDAGQPGASESDAEHAERSATAENTSQPANDRGHRPHDANEPGESDREAGNSQAGSKSNARDEQAQGEGEPSDRADAQRLQRELESRGIDEATAQRTVDDVQQAGERRQIDRQADERTQELRDALKQAARKTREGNEPRESPPSQSQPQAEPDSADTQSADAQQQRDTGGEQPMQRPSPGGAPTEQRQTEPGPGDQAQETGTTNQRDAQPQPSAEPDVRESPSTGQSTESQDNQQAANEEMLDPNQPEGEGSPKIGEVLRDMAKRMDEAKSSEGRAQHMQDLARRLADSMTPQERERLRRQLEREQSGAPNGKPPAAERPGGQGDVESERRSDDVPTTDGNQSPSGRQGDRPEDDRDGGHESPTDRTPGAGAPDAAGDRRDPGRSGAPDRLAGARARERAVREADDVDLRGQENPDRTIYRWLDDTPPDGDAAAVPPAGAGSAGTNGDPLALSRSAVRRATESAERAVSESTTPSRYHSYIRRFFGRLAREAQTDSPGGSDVTEKKE